MRRISLYLSIIALLLGCNNTPKNANFEALINRSEHSVLMFIAPDCPLCMTLVKSVNDLADSFPEVQFMAVHSGMNYEAMELNMFVTETGFKPPVFRDMDYTIAHQFEATITPEFILVDREGNVLYQGLLDDRILELGNYKQQWSKHYLYDALKAVNEGKPVAVSRTEPVGCVLEY